MLLRFALIFTSYFCFAIYNIRAYAFCQSILIPSKKRKFGNFISLAFNFLALSLSLFYTLPVFLSLVVIYFTVLLQFLYLFRGDLIALIFCSGTFMFHIMNVKMIVTSIFILIYDIPSYSLFEESGLSVFCTFVTALLLLNSLEVFQKVITHETVQTLMENRSQLRFVTSSMMLINVYLLILSVSYSGLGYSTIAAIFLLTTSLLLFGAFYTSFWHAVKMSVMMEHEIKSKRLEAQLKATKEDIAELQAFAFTDTLTAVHNRRYGIDELNQYIREQTPFCLCFIDIDHLKYVNDHFGHEEGDRYILDVVKVLTGACTADETLSRMGGDEFMLLLPRLSHAIALERLGVVSETVSRIPSVYHPSISYGIVEVKADSALSATQILRQADQRMYQYKQANHPDYL